MIFVMSTFVVSFLLTYLSSCDMAQPSTPKNTNQQEPQPNKTTTCHDEDPLKNNRSMSGLNSKSPKYIRDCTSFETSGRLFSYSELSSVFKLFDSRSVQFARLKRFSQLAVAPF